MARLPARLRALDDLLFDRVYQPLVDLAAPFDVKARHLSAGCFLVCGAVWYETHPLWTAPIALMLFFLAVCVLAGSKAPREKRRFARLWFVISTLIGASLPPPDIAWLVFMLVEISAFYLADCDDKPPKRRWWKELKRAIEALAWAPELEPTGRGG